LKAAPSLSDVEVREYLIELHEVVSLRKFLG